jgi:hypothetical protein
MSLLSDRVKRMLISTHSRNIEQTLFNLFQRHHWRLVAEEPCEMRYRERSGKAVLRMFRDGNQYWLNPRLS